MARIRPATRLRAGRSTVSGSSGLVRTGSGLLVPGSAIVAGTGLVVGGAFGGATIQAQSASFAEVSAAYQSANDGDIVEIPDEAADWGGNTLVHNKAVWLKGAGSTTVGTRLSGSGEPLISIQGVSSARGYQKLSGVRFTSHGGSFPIGAYLAVFPLAGTVNIRVTECYFTLGGGDGWAIFAAGCGDGNNTGWLLDSSTFIDCHGIEAEGSNFEAWKLPLALGSAAYLYIEDVEALHTTQFGGSIGWALVDIRAGGRVAIRHCNLQGGFIETHDVARAGAFVASGRAWEIYANAISNVGQQLFKGIDLTCGSGVVWNNAFAGNIQVPLGLYDYKTYDNRGIGACDGTQNEDGNTPGQSGWICQFQVGSSYVGVPSSLPAHDPQFDAPWYKGDWGQYAVSDPAYFWGNTYNGEATVPEDTGGTRLQAGRDYINDVRPSYVPYTYPHPLRSI